MSAAVVDEAGMVDVALPMQAKALSLHCAEALSQALCEHLHWLATDVGSGVHPLKLVAGNEGIALVPHRARLLLRIQRARADAVQLLAQTELFVAGNSVRLGLPRLRELVPHSTIYAHRVISGAAGEQGLMTLLDAALAAMGVACERVCGLHQSIEVNGQRQDAFSLMLHGLTPSQSLRLQTRGLGPHRLLGCGIFVPHKSAAAV